MELLKKSFSSEALKHVMCKSMISIDYLGYVYDCDFNQMLGINLSNSEKKHISVIDKLEFKKRINIADHCYGCTAGAGSSCGGSLL
jgi:MoaA/NifB/PqqE/SkfB family radical SAM enzyme